MSWIWKEQKQFSFDVFLDQSSWICKIFLSEDTKILHCIISFYTYSRLSLVAFCHQPHPKTKEPWFPSWVRNCTGIDGKQTTRSFWLQDHAFGRYLWISWKILDGRVELEIHGSFFDATSLIKRSDVEIFETSKALGCLPSCQVNMCHTRTEALKQFQLISDVSNFTCLNAASIRMLEIGNLTRLHPWCNLFQLDFKQKKCRPFLLKLRPWLRYGTQPLSKLASRWNFETPNSGQPLSMHQDILNYHPVEGHVR